MIPMEAFIITIPKYIFMACIITILYYFIHKTVLKSKRKSYTYLSIFLLICYLLLLYEVVFGLSGGFSVSEYRMRPNLVPFRDLINVYSMGPRAMLLQVVINVIMFAPFGFLLPLAFSRLQSLKKAFVISLISAISIEVLQYFFGRSADVDDVIMNVIGACIGYILFLSYIKIGKMIKTRKVHSAMLE